MDAEGMLWEIFFVTLIFDSPCLIANVKVKRKREPLWRTMTSSRLLGTRTSRSETYFSWIYAAYIEIVKCHALALIAETNTIQDMPWN